MSKIEIIKQPRVKRYERNGSINIFGKEFDLAPTSDNLRMILHEDYPLIDKKDLRDFISYSEKKDTIVISGCKAKVHPYRVMYIDEDGYDSHLTDIPQSVRGNRHCYPNVFNFIPAFVSIPPNISIQTFISFEDIDMYVMPAKKLLDKSSLIDRLLIMSLHQSSNSV
ncbi:MAG: hypothetical protein ABIF87_06565 [Pseudomonadota bacterium]